MGGCCCAVLILIVVAIIFLQATVPPSVVTTNECGCENGGTCTIITRRGRIFRRCTCPPEWRGAQCQIR